MSEPRPLVWSSLRTRNFRYFLAAQLFSSTGLWMQRIAQDWLMYTLTGSAMAVGVTAALQFIPSLLFGLIGGVVADRYPKHRILLLAQCTQALLSAILGVLVLTQVVQTWHVFVLAFALGTSAALDVPARHSFVNELVSVAQLRNAISLNAVAYADRHVRHVRQQPADHQRRARAEGVPQWT